MRLFGRVFVGARARRILRQARTAELRGELAQAAELYAEAGRLDETSRVMLLRGDAEADTAARLRHYVQALATAPAGSAAHTHARRKHALLVVAVAGTDTPWLDQPLRRLSSAANYSRLSMGAAAALAAMGGARGRRAAVRPPGVAGPGSGCLRIY